MPLWPARETSLQAPAPQAARRENFRALTGLRAVAGALVYVHHFPAAGLDAYPRLLSIVRQGYVGVALFFVLSGFLIHYSYAHAVRFELGWLRRYWRNRVARIFPLYLLALGLTHLFGRPSRFLRWWCDFTLLQGFSAAHKFDGVPQAWSLTVEETFYLTFPLVILASRRLLRPLRTCLGATYLLGAALTAFAMRHPQLEVFESFLFTGGYTFFDRALPFYLGMFLARRYLEQGPLRAAKLHATWTYLGGGAALMAAVSLGWLVQPGQEPTSALTTYPGLQSVDI